MATIKDLKLRIKSVKSTQKITKAMKMVAAAKLRRARERLEAASPYLEKLNEMVVNLSEGISFEESAPELLIGRGKDDIHLLIVVTSDRGLCGAFNASIIKAAKKLITEQVDEGKTIKILCVGKKSYEGLKAFHESRIIGKIELENKNNVSFEDAERVASKIIDLFNSGEFDNCTIFYNKFKNAISQVVQIQQLIPVKNLGAKEEIVEKNVHYEYEPSEAEILTNLLPRNLAARIYNAFLENAASEQGARMTAMDNATNNASEMIRNLSLEYNRTRQASITRELIEIISGAEAI